MSPSQRIPADSEPAVESLSAVLATAVQRLPGSLADATARSGLLAIGHSLPATLALGPMGLELRLAGPTKVDFFAAAAPRQQSFAEVCQMLRASPDGHRWAEPSRAADLAAALERWESGVGALPSVARYLLLESDAPALVGGALPVPSVFLAPRGARDVVRPGQPPNAFHRNVVATVTAAAELSGVWPDPATAVALQDVVDALPEAGDIFAVGAMVGRGSGPSIRVALRRLEPDQIITVLTRAGRRRQAEVLAAWVAGAPAEQFDIAFELGPGAETRVGLEMSPDHDWQQARLDGWPPLLDFLVASDVARADRAAAVPRLVDALGDPRWGLAHVKVAADVDGLLPVSKLYVGLITAAAMGNAAAAEAAR